MSYEKAMKFSRNPKKAHKQPLGFCTIDYDARRRLPWLGSAWFEPGMDEERNQYIKDYQEETERLLQENPNLKIID